jgi:DivIVA domain-containing protein
MEKFNRTLRGYDPIEVNQFLDHVIKQVEKMVDDIKEKDARIAELEAMEEENIKARLFRSRVFI